MKLKFYVISIILHIILFTFISILGKSESRPQDLTFVSILSSSTPQTPKKEIITSPRREITKVTKKPQQPAGGSAKIISSIYPEESLPKILSEEDFVVQTIPKGEGEGEGISLGGIGTGTEPYVESDTIFSIQDLDYPVECLSYIPPEYPINARRIGIEGKVLVKLLINSAGKAESAEIIKEEPKKFGFGEAVMKVVYRYRFTPPVSRNREVSVYYLLPIRFSLEE